MNTFGTWRLRAAVFGVLSAVLAFAAVRSNGGDTPPGMDDPRLKSLVESLTSLPPSQASAASIAGFEGVPLFNPIITYTNAVEDFDGDENLDIAFSSLGGPGDMAVYFGDGDGGFSDGLVLPVYANLLVSGYVNDDEYPDLVASIAARDSTYVLLSQGDGTFAAPIGSYTPEGIVVGLTVGYANSDTHADLVIGDDHGLDVYLGDGTGHFGSRYSVPVPQGYTTGLADLNNDGFMDLVVGGQGVTILLGDSAGQFTLSDNIDVGGSVFSLQVTLDDNVLDFNGDGNADIVISYPQSGSSAISEVYVLFTDGAGHISSTLQLDVPGTAYPVSVLDFNYDDHLDIISGCSSRWNLTIFYGDGTGGVVDTDVVDLDSVFAPISMSVGDFREDGLWDIVVGSSITPSGILINTSGSGFSFMESQMTTCSRQEINVKVRNPQNMTVDRYNNHIAGARRRLRYADGDNTLDRLIFDLNVLEGEYRLDVNASSSVAGSEPYSLDVELGGTPYRFARNAIAPPIGQTDQFLFQVGNAVTVNPVSGSFTADLTPNFNWGADLSGQKAASLYEIQIDDSPDFSSPELTVSDLPTPMFTPATPLLADTLYYWRYRVSSDGVWSEYSDGFAVNTVTLICECACHGNPVCDQVIDVSDVVATIEVAFRGMAPVTDLDCVVSRTDVNCDEITDVFDVVGVVDVAFRGAEPTTAFCNPCAP